MAPAGEACSLRMWLVPLVAALLRSAPLRSAPLCAPSPASTAASVTTPTDHIWQRRCSALTRVCDPDDPLVGLKLKPGQGAFVLHLPSPDISDDEVPYRVATVATCCPTRLSFCLVLKRRRWPSGGAEDLDGG